MAELVQIETRAKELVQRAIKIAPFISSFLEKMDDEMNVQNDKWQDYHGDQLDKVRIAKKSCLVALDKFWAAAKDQARKELDNEKKQ